MHKDQQLALLSRLTVAHVRDHVLADDYDAVSVNSFAFTDCLTLKFNSDAHTEILATTCITRATVVC